MTRRYTKLFCEAAQSGVGAEIEAHGTELLPVPFWEEAIIPVALRRKL
jgi:hypothetical protein